MDERAEVYTYYPYTHDTLYRLKSSLTPATCTGPVTFLSQIRVDGVQGQYRLFQCHRCHHVIAYSAYTSEIILDGPLPTASFLPTPDTQLSDNARQPFVSEPLSMSRS